MRWQDLQLNLAAVRRLPSVALLLAGAAAAIYANSDLTVWLQYDRAAIASGELWRLVTCHWTHWSVDHLLWDAVVFGFLAVLCERDGRLRLVACLLVAATLIPIGLWWSHPQMLTYRGLSGIDSALFNCSNTATRFFPSVSKLLCQAINSSDFL
ncbi:MAG: rhombosortase [Bacteroidota bacterium]